MDGTIREKSSQDEKKIQLYLKQKELLDAFLERGAISKGQYEKSFNDLTEKMGMKHFIENISDTGLNN